LVKKATLKVGYSAEDLEAAGGSAPRLRLARWDSAGQKWQVMDTAIYDSSLEVQTDRFSTWAVIVTPERKTCLPLIFTALLFGITIGLIVLISQKKRKH